MHSPGLSNINQLVLESWDELQNDSTVINVSHLSYLKYLIGGITKTKGKFLLWKEYWNRETDFTTQTQKMSFCLLLVLVS